jgi:hypothetical protein
MSTLIDRIYKDRLLWALCKLVGSAGFPFHELHPRVKHLVQEQGVKKLSVALFEVCCHHGWWTQFAPW